MNNTYQQNNYQESNDRDNQSRQRKNPFDYTFSNGNGDDNRNRRSIWVYYGIILLVILLFNLLFMPNFRDYGVQEVSYDTFLNQIEAGDIEVVELKQYEILWTQAEEQNMFYKTARIDDPKLVNRLNEADVTFGQEIYEPTSPILSFLLSFILPLLFFWGIGSFLMNRFTKRMGGNPALNFGKSGAKVYSKTDNSKDFSDVAGQEETKESLQEIVDFLAHPEKYEAIGAKSPKGVLLVGPPGTGKTLLAQAVAGEADVPFFSISGSEFVEMFVGRGAAKVRDLFKQANENAPCIVFIDEIDTIGKKRDGAGVGGNDEREQTLNQLLHEMDGFEENKGVVILAATNRPESLDKALLRPGRFDRQIRVELPDLQGRIAILKVHAKDYKIADNIDYGIIARMTAGASGAELANIVNEAALRAVRMGRSVIEQEDLQESVEVVIAGAERKNAILSEEEKRIVSYHEIGHALVAAKQSHSAPVEKITIIPRTSSALGYTLQVEQDEKSLYSKEELFNKIVTLAGGRAAEEVVFGSITTGASNDIEKMTQLARSMITQYGMSDSFGMVQFDTQVNPYLSDDTTSSASAATQEKIDQEVVALVNKAYEKAKQILTDNLDKLHELSEYLLEEETITGKQFMEILQVA